MKFLLFVALLGVVWWLWRKRSVRPALPPTPPAPERMVVCQHCHVHLPESDSIADGEQFYCCDAHRQAGPTSRAR